MDVPQWTVPGPWLEKCRALARSEVERLERTVRYQLGRDLIAMVRKPWRLGTLAKTVRNALVEGGVGNTPAIIPPYPTVEASRRRVPASSVREAMRAEVARLWARVRALETSLDYRVGNAIIESSVSLRSMLRLPRNLLNVVKTAPPDVQPVPTEPDSTVVTDIRADQVDTPRWTCVAPSWLEEMLALEGIGPDDEGASGATGLLVALDGSSELTSSAEQAISRAERSDRPMVGWVVGSEIPPSSKSLLHKLHAVGVADSSVLPMLRDELSAPVHHLPPAIQPRIHNPIGWWGGTPEVGVKGRYESDYPLIWRALVETARGRTPKDKAVDGINTTLGSALPEGRPPAWADDETAMRWIRHARLRRVIGAETVGRRIRTLEAALGADSTEPEKRLATILVCTNRPNFIPQVLDAYARQSYEPRELVLVLHGSAFDQAAVRDRLNALSLPGRVVAVADKLTLGEALQAGCDESDGRYFVRMDDDDWYGAHYVEDFVAALEFSEAALAGKPTFVLRVAERDRMYLCNPGLEYQYTVFRGGGPKLAFRREVLSEVKWRPLRVGEDKWFVRDCLARAFPPLSIDSFNFVYVRRRPSAHTTSRPAAEWVKVNKSIPFPASARSEDFEA